MTNPYLSLKDTSFWKRSVSRVPPHLVDPVVDFSLKLTPEQKVATAGSCFAQHIARHLQNSGYNYYVLEAGHPLIDPESLKEFNYGTFSARYGNIYTTRQLLQLFKRAFGLIQPRPEFWLKGKSSYRDPFRPNIQPDGFTSPEELFADQSVHLNAVKKMFETLDVFVFTLGLTECWRNKQSGIIYPIAPGIEGGEYNTSEHEFYNQNVQDVTDDLSEFLQLLRDVNPAAEVILTVSPVPLMATARDDAHVLSATTYSKSVLRVAAEVITAKYEFVHYFPSYEIITGNFNRGGYYADDLRGVLESGVNHVMGLFLKHATESVSEVKSNPSTTELEKVSKPYTTASLSIVDVECDEELMDRDKM